jgi:hypothetical protein
MKLQVILLILQIGLIVFLIVHQKAIWEELKVHRSFLENLLDGEEMMFVEAEPEKDAERKEPARAAELSQPSSAMLLPQMLLRGLLCSTQTAAQEPESPLITPTCGPVVEEMEGVEEEKLAGA